MSAQIFRVQFKDLDDHDDEASLSELIESSGFLKSKQDKKLLKQDHIYCLYLMIETKVIAYIILSLVFEEAEIFHVFVLKKFRGMRYGEKILKAAVDFCGAQAVEKIFLELRGDNAVAFNVYSKLGFNKLTTRKNYYPDGEVAVVMNKKL